MITYLEGDATNPIGDDFKLLPHITNDLGAWGSGYVLALSKKWSEPEYYYRMHEEERLLGKNQYIRVEHDTTVVNMCAQHGIGRDKDGNPPIRYDALRECLKALYEYAYNLSYTKGRITIHAPRFGSGLSGGSWEVIEAMIKEEIPNDVYIYDLPKTNKF
jgi:hypothetical protein